MQASEVWVIVVGLISLLGLYASSGVLRTAVLVVTESLMPFNFKIEVLSEEEAKQATARTRSADNVPEYVELLKSLGVTEIGRTFKLPVETLEVLMPADAKRKEKPEEHAEFVDFIVDSVDDDNPDGISVRTMKRRLGAAIKVIGFELAWKEPKGWLIGTVKASTVTTTTDGADTTAQTQAAPVAPATPPAAPAAPAAPAGRGGRVIRQSAAPVVEPPTPAVVPTPPTPPRGRRIVRQ